MPLKPDPRHTVQTTWYFDIDPPVFVAEPSGGYRDLNEVQVVRTVYSDTLSETWRASARGTSMTSKRNKRGGQMAPYSKEAHEFEEQALAIVKEGL